MTLKRVLSVSLVKGIGILSGFALSIVLGRYLGPEGLGYYTLLLMSASIFSQLARLGGEAYLLKKIGSLGATYIAYRDPSIVNCHWTIAGMISFIVIALLLFISMAEVSQKAWMVALGGFLAALLALSTVYFQVLLAISRTVISTICSSTLLNVLCASGVVCLTLFDFQGDRLFMVVIIYAFSLLVAWLFSGGLVMRYSSLLSTFSSDDTLLRFLRSSMPFFGIGIISFLSFSSEKYLLGFLGSGEDLGYYSVASSMAALIGMVVLIANSIIGPQFAHKFAKGDITGLKKLFKVSRFYSSFAALGLFLAIVALSKWALQFFWGNEFVQAYSVLVILCIGQLVNVLFGSVALILQMANNEAYVLKCMLVSLILGVVLGWLLIPTLGGFGAALANLAVFSLSNVLLAARVKFLFRSSAY